MPKHGIPEPISLPIPDPAPWDEVRTIVRPVEEPAPPTGPTPEEFAAFLNGMGPPTRQRYWAAVIRALDPPARVSLRRQLETTRPAP